MFLDETIETRFFRWKFFGKCGKRSNKQRSSITSKVKDENDDCPDFLRFWWWIMMMNMIIRIFTMIMNHDSLSWLIIMMMMMMIIISHHPKILQCNTCRYTENPHNSLTRCNSGVGGAICLLWFRPAFFFEMVDSAVRRSLTKTCQSR